MIINAHNCNCTWACNLASSTQADLDCSAACQEMAAFSDADLNREFTLASKEFLSVRGSLAFWLRPNPAIFEIWKAEVSQPIAKGLDLLRDLTRFLSNLRELSAPCQLPTLRKFSVNSLLSSSTRSHDKLGSIRQLLQPVTNAAAKQLKLPNLKCTTVTGRLKKTGNWPKVSDHADFKGNALELDHGLRWRLSYHNDISSLMSL